MALINIFEIVLILLFGFYFLFITFIYRGIFRLKKKSIPNNLKASVIVPFRNEEKNLRRCVQSILNQNFESDRFEIILVDDDSTDSSIKSVEDFLKSDNIKLIKNQNGSGKKSAIETGISYSKNEIIVTTDADCYHNQNWLRSIVESFDEKTGFVAGKVVYSKAKNVFEEFQKIEFASLVGIGAAFIGNKIPLLANGASCAYRKDLFYKVGGFKDNISLASGDEEFLMQKIHFDSDYQVKFCALNNSVTYTLPIHSINKFINQRKRWVSKVPFYRNKFLLPVLTLLYLFYVASLISIILAFIYTELLKIVLFVLGIKMIIDLTFMIKAYRLLEISKDVKERIKLMLLFPLAEFFHLIYISIVPILSYITGFNWKDREFKR